MESKGTMESLLSVAGLTTWIGAEPRPARVVDGVDLAIRRGETFALLGESGCGKSMTALSLMRLLPPAARIVAGSVTLGERELLALPEREMRRVRGGQMAMIFQEPQTSLNPVLSVGAQIAEAVALHDPRPRAEVTARVLELLDQVGIPDPERRAREFPHQLSGGMKQRVMIAMALGGRPDLLIADEPTTALDVTIQAQVLRLLGKLRQETGMAVLLITHDLGVVAETADRLAVMYAGQIVETADSASFFLRPAHPYSQKLLASLPTPATRLQGLATIPGMVPALDQPFPGCRFVARCDRAQPVCVHQEPPWYPVGGRGHRVRCHLWGTEEVLSVSAPAPRATAAPVPPTTQSPLTILEAEDLKVHFPIHRGVLQRVVGWVRAVDGVSLRLERGRTLALVGESGCGKTTVGKGILQLIRPTGGVVRYNGEDLVALKSRRMRRYRKDLQIIFQDPFASMNPRMPVGDIVGEGLHALGLVGGRAARLARVVALLADVGMPAESVQRYPHEFSGGQRQRICIARALAVEPQVVICDEPTSALDVSVQAQILNLLKSLQDNLGLAYLFITHNLSLVAYLAHQVAVMYLGRIVEGGTVEEVLGRPRHPYTKALLSAVPMVDPAQRRVIIRLEGDLPSPAAPPAGCHFHPRCPEATLECRRAYPERVSLSATHFAACWRIGV